MKNKINNITNMGILLGLIAIVALCMALPVHAGSSNPSHGGGPGGGLPNATVSTVNQLIADINYANNVGGAITINLAAGTTFVLTSANNSTDGGNGLPVIGGTKSVALTIIGNGDTIKRINVVNRKSDNLTNPFHLFEVAPGASLTLDHITLQGGFGGAIFNKGTLNVINGCSLSDNYGGIENAGGTVTVSNSTLSDNYVGGIDNVGGTVAVSNSTLSDNVSVNGGGIFNNGGTVTVSNSTLFENGASFGGGIYNDSNGTVTVDHSTLTNNYASNANNDEPIVVGSGEGGAVYNNAGTVIISNSTLSRNVADLGGYGIFNGSKGTVTVENFSSLTGNGADVDNLGVLYLDSTSTISLLYGNPAISF